MFKIPFVRESGSYVDMIGRSLNIEHDTQCMMDEAIITDSYHRTHTLFTMIPCALYPRPERNLHLNVWEMYTRIIVLVSEECIPRIAQICHSVDGFNVSVIEAGHSKVLWTTAN